MIRLSASLIKEYLSCKKKGYYRINFPDVAVQSDDMIIGEVIHKTLEDVYDRDKNYALDYCRKLLSTYNLKDPNPMKLGKITRSMNTFFNAFHYLVNNTDEIEKYFKVSYSDSAYITGKMDRITKDGVIIDWKTGGKTPDSIDNDVQFIIYYISYKQIYGEYPKKVLLASLYSGKIVEFTPVDYYIKTLYNDVIPNMLDDLEKERFERTGFYNGNCYFCQYKDTCWGEI